jgi:phospholipid-binding lipoprotein MlaA
MRVWNLSHTRAALLACSLLVGLSGCTTPSPEALAANDPLEATNRDVFAVNVWVDHNVAKPVVEGYRTVVPEPARDGLHNALKNLRAPVIFANDVLQGRPTKAIDTLARVVINSTIGLGGFIDVASKIGIPYHDNDFGVTLGVAGAPQGSYLMLPLLGPQSPRDLIGTGVDGLFDPFTWSRFPGRHELLRLRGSFDVLDTINRDQDQFDEIERTSIDFYASVRSLYRQNRNAQVRGDQALFQNLPEL